MDAIKPRLAEVIEDRIRRALLHAHTNIPAEVVSYNPVTNTLVAKPVTKVPYPDAHDELEYDELPAIPNVPVMWPRAGGKIVRMNIEPGDFVWLSFSEAALSEWRLTGQVSQPADTRRLSIGYPYAFPGAFPDTSPLSPADAAEVTAGAIVIGEDGGAAQMLIGGTVPGVRFGKLAVSPIVLSVPLLAHIALQSTALTALKAYVDAVAAAAAVGVVPAVTTAATAAQTAVTAAAVAPPVASTLTKSV